MWTLLHWIACLFADFAQVQVKISHAIYFWVVEKRIKHGKSPESDRSSLGNYE